MTTFAMTGASGFIGRHVVPLLLERGDTVRVLDRSVERARFAEPAQAVAGDVTDRGSIERLVSGAEVVIHLAGLAHTNLESDADRERARVVNVGGAENVLEAAKAAGVRRVVIASSAHVYAGQSGVEIREDAPQGAENLYAQTKIEVEEAARAVGANGLEVVIGRPCLTYGPNAGFNLLKLMQAIDRGYYFHIRGRRVMRSFGSVHTAARAFVHLADKGKPGEAYNIADREAMDLREFTNAIADDMRRRRPLAVPHGLVWGAAAGCSMLRIVGKKGPITFDSLGKLTQSFALDTGKLAASGFEWDARDMRARTEMVNTYLAGKR